MNKPSALFEDFIDGMFMKTCLKLLISDANFVCNRNNGYSITYERKMKDTEFLKLLANILKIGQEIILNNCK